MNRIRLLYLAVGVVLLGLVFYETDLSAVAGQISTFGWGIPVVLGVYLVAFVMDCVAWGMTIPRIPLDLRWTYRLWKLRMVGEAYNNITPLAGVGGEPVKAILLRSQFGIPIREGITSVVLARTTFLIALVIFLCSGFVLVAIDPRLSMLYKTVAGIGFVAFATAIVLFFLTQRFGLASRFGRRILPRRLAAKLDTVLAELGAVEEAMADFYKNGHDRLVISVGLALGNWILGVIELQVTFYYLGHPLDLWDAWIIEALVQLIRAAAFFVPAGLGLQDGAFLLVTSALTGVPALGVSAALIRRGRELVWISLGMILGWIDHFRLPPRGGKLDLATEDD